jgi:hypothetical protein
MNGSEPVEGAAAEMRLPDTGPSTTDLARSVRNLKRWIIALTVLVALTIIGGVAVAGITVWGIVGMGGAMSDPMAPTEQTVGKARDEIKSALGDRLEKVDVRLVSARYDSSPPFPYSLVDGVGDSKSIYIEYKLKNSSTLVAGVIEGPMGMDVASSGLLPTRGTLASRMTDEQFAGILKVYAEQTKSPLGSVRRYSDHSAMMEGKVSSDMVPVGAQEYPSKELWSASEGTLVKGDRVAMGDASPFQRKAYVFHEDPKTGEFTYVGTEPAFGMGGP